MNEQKFHVGIKALIMNGNGEVLIINANPAELRGGELLYWDLPGGRIKEGNSVEETLAKEVEEELEIGGHDVKIIRPFDGSISNLKIPIGEEKFGLVLFVYLCKLKTKKKFNLSFEHTEFKWASIGEAKKLLSVKFSKGFVDKLDSLKKGV